MVASYQEQIESFENQARFYKRLAEIHEEAAVKAKDAAKEFGLNGAGPSTRTTTKTTSSLKRPKNDLTLNEVILGILDRQKNGLNLAGLLEAVKKTGYKTSSKNGEKGLYQIIYQAIHKMQNNKKVVREAETKRYRLLA